MNRFTVFLLVIVIELTGQSVYADSSHKVDSSTLTGKVMCGYQGWFNCVDDGANLGWTHWVRNRQQSFIPGNASVDLWPDVSELDSDERFATEFKHADGRVAEVFSSANRKTVMRHFKWMEDYAIDGAFVQRFASELRHPDLLRHRNAVLSHAREGAEKHGRAFAVMYDLSGMKRGSMNGVLDDWLRLRSEQVITESNSYLHQNGKPLVAVWGVGFNDRHQHDGYSLVDCRKLIAGLKKAGCSVMLGVPTGWREQNRDSVDDVNLHDILSLADVISPWTPGRYRNPEEVARHADQCWKPDVEWCRAEDIDYLPVVFPGFSWHNLTQGKSGLNEIPRLKGEFLWSQIVAAKRSGADMIYVAMFDEVDEGTAIFKCTNDPPIGDGVKFLTYEGLPSDHYLKLIGHAGKLLRGEVQSTERMPVFSTGID